MASEGWLRSLTCSSGSAPSSLAEALFFGATRLIRLRSGSGYYAQYRRPSIVSLSWSRRGLLAPVDHIDAPCSDSAGSPTEIDLRVGDRSPRVLPPSPALLLWTSVCLNPNLHGDPMLL
jgi:hypothetical protein